VASVIVLWLMHIHFMVTGENIRAANTSNPCSSQNDNEKQEFVHYVLVWHSEYTVFISA